MHRLAQRARALAVDDRHGLEMRRLKLGYSRAARIVDEMETRGIVGPFEGSKPRQLLITKEQWQELKMKGAYGAVPPEAEELPPPDEEN